MYTTEQEVEDFIEEYGRSRVVISTTVRATLNRAIEFEYKFNKPFHEFTADEALKMYQSVHAISIVSLQNMNLVLKNAARLIRYKNGKAVDNVYEKITKDLLEMAVDKEKRKSVVLSKDDVKELMVQLLNWTDKAIIFLLFEGVDGYLLDQLTFMKWEQVSRNDLKIYLRNGEAINITEPEYEMLKRGFEEDELVSYGSTARISKVRSVGLYKVRFNSVSDNSNPNDSSDISRRYRFITRRLTLVAKDLGVKLSPSILQTSGLLWYVQRGMEEMDMNFREFTATEECFKIAKRYGIRSALYTQIIRDKLGQYFS